MVTQLIPPTAAQWASVCASCLCKQQQVPRSHLAGPSPSEFSVPARASSLAPQTLAPRCRLALGELLCGLHVSSLGQWVALVLGLSLVSRDRQTDQSLVSPSVPPAM